jgi:hypothetical protein
MLLVSRPRGVAEKTAILGDVFVGFEVTWRRYLAGVAFSCTGCENLAVLGKA